GASVSAIRATLILLLVFGAVLAGRKALTMRNVALAAIFVILVDPAAIFRPSFQLSFAAVTALVGAYEGYRTGFSGPKNWIIKTLGALWAIALTSMIAGAATALFAAYHFQQVAPFGMLGNMVAIPLVSLIVLPAALIGVLLMPLGVEPVFLKTMGWGIEKIIFVAEQISDFGHGVVSAPILGPAALIIGVAGLGWFAFFHQPVRFFGLGLAALLLPVFGTLPAPDIMIADTTKAVAVRVDSQLLLISGRTNSFAVRAWSETYMEEITQATGTQPCDASGCFYLGENYEVALVKTRDAFDEDCRRANLVITRQKSPSSCRGITQVIDSLDLQNNGVHWLKWTGEEFWIRQAISDIHRPWRSQFPD
ncbi:MAG: ComEC/Rec2 family competence protein, partial [Devosiaceae bacterium]|nr:ComEC/Rec2 family competence protein [Devosiaceae bacterium]